MRTLPSALLLSVPLLLAAAEAPEEAPEALLAKIQASLGTVRAAYCEFEQERTLDLFDEPLRSSGVMVFEAPGRVRWETVRPYESILVSDGSAVAQYEKVDGRWKRLQVAFPGALRGFLEKVTAIQRGQVEGLSREYEVTAARRPGGAVLTLVPRAPEARKTIAAIELALREDLSAATGVTLKEPNGDATRIVFKGEMRDPPLPEKTFDAAAPVDLKTLQERVHGAAKPK
jgi:outer membrane lipoprotein carrier protein